jgi:protoporphyrinogen oxidase
VDHLGASESQCVIIGAGPAGLTAAYEFARLGRQCVVLEADSQVGGLARTVEYRGCRFDIGGHRFFTKVGIVNKLWRSVLGDDFLERPRLSRIYYRSRYFQYPLDPFDALWKLGIAESARCVGSYIASKANPKRPEHDLETWLINRFGRRLYKMFFESYTEKVWGMPCSRIKAEWAAQRIRGLSLVTLASHALTPNFLQRKTPKTLIERFHYPRLGPGQMWERMAELIARHGCSLLHGHRVEKIFWRPGAVTAVQSEGGRFSAAGYISTMPIRSLIRALDPAPPPAVVAAASSLQYRDFITVALILRARDLFPDNWIYIHDPEVRAGRIQNYKNWSPDMVSDPELTGLGFEYFCSRDDSLWSMSDGELRKLASKELGKLGLGDPAAVVDACVVRVPKAYPVYDGEYGAHLDTIRNFLRTVPNLHLAGRNGMHRYNNQDHSMLTGMLAARNVAGAGSYDLWKINADSDYHEEGFFLSAEESAELEKSQPFVPEAFTADAS